MSWAEEDGGKEAVRGEFFTTDFITLKMIDAWSMKGYLDASFKDPFEKQRSIAGCFV